MAEVRSMLGKVRSVLRARGVNGLVLTAWQRVYRPRARSFRAYEHLFRGRVGFEIGGPSRIFARGGLIPVYPIAGHLDNCNFSQATIWEGALSEGVNFRYDKHRPLGYQYIREATDLEGIPSGAYDFVLSSHTIEHTANPLRALQEWKRILREDGIMVLVLPHKDGTFDHRRPVTPLAHLVEDFERGTGEGDLTHLPEILELHDLKKDPPAGGFEEFKKRSENNFENRSLHHHVFDTELVLKMMDHIGLRVLDVEPSRPHHIIAIGQKVPVRTTHNQSFLDDKAGYKARSPFPSDRVASRS